MADVDAVAALKGAQEETASHAAGDARPPGKAAAGFQSGLVGFAAA